MHDEKHKNYKDGVVQEQCLIKELIPYIYHQNLQNRLK